MGLVPKDKGRKTRLIFHLSYPRDGDSVNSGIPKRVTSVKYPDFMEAVKLCVVAGASASCAKSDMSMAFRNIPCSSDLWYPLILKAEHPETKEIFWFVDKCLPFGSSISCKIFQDFSDSIAHLVRYRSSKPLVNYLDDYFFMDIQKVYCDGQVRIFLNISNAIRFPVSLEKTEWGNSWQVFLGMLLDAYHQIIGIPSEKIHKALQQIDYFLTKKSRKVTVCEVQKLCSTLNFIG